jgi:hypothetical protein
MTSASAMNSVFAFIEEKRTDLMVAAESVTPAENLTTTQVDSTKTMEQIDKDEKNVTDDHNEL